MLSEEEVMPVLHIRAKSLCRKFSDAHLEENELISEAWKHNPCDVPDVRLASTKIGKDMLDYVRVELGLNDKHHHYHVLQPMDPAMMYNRGYIDRHFDGIDFQDFLHVLLERSNLRPLEKTIVILILIQGYNGREAAQKIGRSPCYISNSLQRAKLRLREVCIDLGVIYGS